MKKKITGFQRKYLVYAGGLLLIAILLSSVSVWYYMRKNMMGIVTDQYRFRNEKLGMALDVCFRRRTRCWRSAFSTTRCRRA